LGEAFKKALYGLRFPEKLSWDPVPGEVTFVLTEISSINDYFLKIAVLITGNKSLLLRL
jgi:hypothetical protein